MAMPPNVIGFPASQTFRTVGMRDILRCRGYNRRAFEIPRHPSLREFYDALGFSISLSIAPELLRDLAGLDFPNA